MILHLISALTGDKPCVGACLHQKLLGIVDQGIEVADAAVSHAPFDARFDDAILFSGQQW